jgi:hypothetical protein
MNYAIVEGASLPKVAKNITKKLQAGWRLHDHPICATIPGFASGRFAQALMLPDEAIPVEGIEYTLILAKGGADLLRNIAEKLQAGWRVYEHPISLGSAYVQGFLRTSKPTPEYEYQFAANSKKNELYQQTIDMLQDGWSLLGPPMTVTLGYLQTHSQALVRPVAQKKGKEQ